MNSTLTTPEAMLLEMGIRPLWRRKHSTSTEEHTATQFVPPSLPDENAPLATKHFHVSATSSSSNWESLSKDVASCHACVLCEHRNQAVLGVGDLSPEWLFIGEGPGAEEDAKGEPFVGQAGRLLDNMLLALGLNREQGVYIANAVKCRPPGNRTPEHSEMAACHPFLEQQIAWLRPKIIVLLGRAAVHTVLKEDKTLGSLRQQRFDYQGIPVVVTYHPAYLLRNLADKSKAWEDLVFAKRCLRG